MGRDAGAFSTGGGGGCGATGGVLGDVAGGVASAGDPLDVRYAAVLAGEADGAAWNDVQLDIQRAQERRKGECMRERGFDYRDRPVELRITVGPPLLTTEPDYARQFGFGLSEPIPASVSDVDDPNSPAYRARPTHRRRPGMTLKHRAKPARRRRRGRRTG